MATPIKQNLEAPLSEGQLRLSLETKLERRAEEGRWIYREKDVEDETARQKEKTTDNIHHILWIKVVSVIISTNNFNDMHGNRGLKLADRFWGEITEQRHLEALC